ncbi:MAG: hypothetical protein PVH61_42310 [Candidatus Aminicenantes bacterium]|jgi:hypothetical protein
MDQWVSLNEQRWVNLSERYRLNVLFMDVKKMIKKIELFQDEY